jgi:class 3 adenylate cyclase
MEAPRLERKLVAILAADVEGYSRHMEGDEVAALATLSSHRLVVDDLIVRHGGRITGTAGDSVLAEFVSVVDAVDCAVAIQQAIAVATADESPERRMLFRIGINVGDIMVKDGDIFGDGVNIAARLEALAEPGGICVSRGVRDHLRNKSAFTFEDLGEQSVKNIAQPIRAFRVRFDGAAPVDAAGIEHVAAPAKAELTADEPAAFELAFWDTIKDGKEPAEFEAYLKRYPDGAFAALAGARRSALLDETVQPEPAPSGAELVAVELAFWDSVKDSENPATYEAYLQKYPEGAFVELARARLDELSAKRRDQ